VLFRSSRRRRLDTGHRLSWSAQREVPPCEAAVSAGTANEQPQFFHRTEALSCVDRLQAGGHKYDPTFYPIRFGKIDMSLVLPDDKCMKTTLSAKRQVSIPKQLCDELELEPGAQIAWEVQDSKLVGRPLPKEGWRSLIGKYKGGPDLVAALLKQRREDREREDRKLAR